MSTPALRCSLFVERRHRFARGAGHHAGQGFENRDFEFAFGGDGRHFKTDIARADDGEARAGLHQALQFFDIGDAAQVVAAGQIGAGSGSVRMREPVVSASVA